MPRRMWPYKAIRKNNIKNKKWYWTDKHQKSFDDVKKAIARDVLLAYPNYSEVFEIYTDASSRQLGAIYLILKRDIE